MVAASAAVAVMVVVMTCSGPGRGTARPAAALGWGRTEGPPRASLRYQRVPETDARDALATEGTIFRVGLAGGPWGWFRGVAEPQFRHGVAVRGPSQKAGGLLGACSWRDGNSLYLPPAQRRPV